MGLSLTNGLLLLSALAPSSLALTIARPGASVGGETVATLTSSYTTTLTNVVTSTSTVLSTAATCTPATTAPPSSAQCSNYIWSRSGTWYEEYCTDASVVGGSTATQLSAMGQWVNNINQCVQVCGMVPNVCNAINYDPALRTCYFISAAASQTLGSGAGYQAITWHTTNPCVGTVTASLETAYSTEYVTTEYTTTYTVTISSTPTPSPTTNATPSSVVLPSQSASIALVSTGSAAASVAIPSPSASSVSTLSSAVSSNVRASSASVAPSSVSSPVRSLIPSSRAVIPPSASSRPSSSTALVIPSSSSVASSLARSSSIRPHASSSTPLIRPSSSLGGISMPSSSALSSGRPTRRTTTISVTETITSSTTICSANTKQTSLPIGTGASSAGQATTSSEVAMTTSTVLTTRTATITACPSSVTNCPARSRTTFLTTETIVLSTTVCPVSETSLIQPTATNAASAAHGESPQEEGFTTSTIFSTRTATITACPSSVTNCPARSRTTFLTTETLVMSTTVCPVTKTSIPQPTGVNAGASAAHSDTSAKGQGFTTSTIFSTRTTTVTACPGSVTDCPASSKTTFLTTETIVASTTICPVTRIDEATIPTASGSGQTPPTSLAPNNHSAGGSAQLDEEYTTSTIFSTRTATITACPGAATNCPARARTTYLTTETLVVSTTICPIAEASRTDSAGQTLSSAGQVADSNALGSTDTAVNLGQGAAAAPASTTLSTRIATITACPSGPVCDATARITSYTTETLVMPVHATSTGVGTGTNSAPEGVDAIHVHGETTTLPATTSAGYAADNAASTVEGCSAGQLGCSATTTATKTYTLVAVGTAVPVPAAPNAETAGQSVHGMVGNYMDAAIAMQTASRPPAGGSSSAVHAASSPSTATLAATVSTGTGSSTSSSTSSAVNALFTGGAVARAPSFMLGAVAAFFAAFIL